jgi:hypothetical protein
MSMIKILFRIIICIGTMSISFLLPRTCLTCMDMIYSLLLFKVPTLLYWLIPSKNMYIFPLIPLRLDIH